MNNEPLFCRLEGAESAMLVMSESKDQFYLWYQSLSHPKKGLQMLHHKDPSA